MMTGVSVFEVERRSGCVAVEYKSTEASSLKTFVLTGYWQRRECFALIAWVNEREAKLSF